MTNSHSVSIDKNARVLVLTGAGVSAESGVPTFRASADGLWEKHRIEDVASPEGFASDPALVWRFYSERRAKALEVVPNPGHFALVELAKKLGDRFMLVTQNVDGLHSRAGSERVIEIHGNLFKTRCSTCDREPFSDETIYSANEVPGCALCAAKGQTGFLRPHIVWFGEMLDGTHLHRVKRFMRDAPALLFVAAGTSGAVYPAANFVRDARSHGGETLLINQDPADNGSLFHHWIQGKSGEVLPTLFAVDE